MRFKDRRVDTSGVDDLRGAVAADGPAEPALPSAVVPASSA